MREQYRTSTNGELQPSTGAQKKADSEMFRSICEDLTTIASFFFHQLFNMKTTGSAANRLDARFGKTNQIAIISQSTNVMNISVAKPQPP